MKSVLRRLKSALQMKSLRGEIQKVCFLDLSLTAFIKDKSMKTAPQARFLPFLFTFHSSLFTLHSPAPFRVRGDSVAGGIVSPFERTDRIGFHQI